MDSTLSSMTPQQVLQDNQNTNNASPVFATPTTLKFTVASRTSHTPSSKKAISSSEVSIRFSRLSSKNAKEKVKSAQHEKVKSKSKSNPAVVLLEPSKTSITSIRSTKSKRFMKMIDPARNDSSNRFCDCINLWTFAELRSEVLTFQTRFCPRCKQPFQRVLFIEKRLTTLQVLLSWKGIAILLLALLQHSFPFFAAYVAILDVLLSSDYHLMDIQRQILLGLTVVFLGATVASIVRSVDNFAQEVVERLGDRRIAEVLPDIHCR